MMRTAAVVCLLFAASIASARDDAGRLAAIVAPNNAQPAVLQPGTTFRALLRANVPLRIESAEGAADLELAHAQPWRGLWLVESRVPAGAAPGPYSLVARASGGDDVVHRAVYVLPDSGESYTVAHVTNLRVGDLRGSDSQLFRVTSMLNARAPDLVIVTGDLTAAGTAEQFRIALDVLNDCTAPTFVAPGPADVRGGLADAYLGNYPVALPYGEDAYLLCPPPNAMTPSNEAKLHIERRRVRAARWSVGAASGFPHDDLRAAITLFVDDPLDFLLDKAADGPARSRSHWGRTTLLTASPGRAVVRWYTVEPRGIELPAPDAE